MEFFTNLFIEVEVVLGAFYLEHINTVMNYVGIAIPSLALILVIGVGIGLMNGWVQMPIKSFLMSAFTITFVTIFAGSFSVYAEYIGGILRALPNDLMGLFSGSNTGNVGEALDAFGDSVLGGIQKMWTNASGIAETAAVAVICVVFFIAWIIMSIAASFALLLAIITLTILVTVGPLFIMFLMFPYTKDYFQKWLTYCISFSFLAMMVGAFLGIVGDIATGYFDDFNESATKIDFVNFAAPMLILYGMYLIFDSAPSLASSLSGGIGLSVGGGIASLASKGTSPFRSVASSTGNKISRKIGDKTQGTRYQGIGKLVDPERRQAKKQVRMHEKTIEQRKNNRENNQKKQTNSAKDNHTTQPKKSNP